MSLIKKPGSKGQHVLSACPFKIDFIKDNNSLLIMAIAVLDFGDPYIDALIAMLNEIKPTKSILLISGSGSSIKTFAECSALIITGGIDSVGSFHLQKGDENIFNLKIPILGIGYGYKIIAEHFGARFVRLDFKSDYEIRKLQSESNNSTSIISSLNNYKILCGNKDYVTYLPTKLWITARSEEEYVIAFEHISQRIYAVQFYPHAKETIGGKKILDNFLKICNI